MQWSVQCWVRVPSGIDIADRSGVSCWAVQRRWVQCVQQLQRRLHVRRYVHVADTGSVQSRAVQSRWLERVPELHKRVRVW